MTRSLSAIAAFLLAASCVAQMGRNYHLEDVTWHISFDESKSTIAGDVINTVTPMMDSVEKIPLNEGKLDIQKVTVNGAEAKFEIDAAHEQMIVDLPKRAAKGDQLKIEITYSGKPEAGVYFVNPDRSTRPITTNVVYTQGEAEDTRYWLPTYDEPEDKATSEGFITVPKGYFALSNGSLLDIQHQGDSDVYHWKIDQPHSTYLISFVAAKMAVGHETWDSIPVDWYVPEGAEAYGATTFGGTADMVRFYSQLTGVKYPYSKFAQSAVPDFPFGGMENISAVTQTIDALVPPDEPDMDEIHGLVLHELAHQWFGDLETCDSWPNNWLNEGFATFLPHFYVREKEGDDPYEIAKLNDIEGAVQAMQMHARPMVETKYNVPMDLFDGHAYAGGSARLFALQALLGEKTFWPAIHQFLVDFTYKAANTDQFFASVGKATGKDLTWFDQQYFHTAALPTVTATQKGAIVTLTQTEPFFTLDVDVWELDNGQWAKLTAPLHGKSFEIKLRNASDPFLVDPMVNWPATVSYSPKLRPDSVQALYDQAPNAAQKLRLAKMASTDGDANLVANLALNEKSVYLRRELSQLVPPTQSTALLKLSQDSDALVREGALTQMLGGKNATYFPRYKEIWKSSASEDEQVLALRGLLQSPNGGDYAGKAYHRASFADQYQSAALDWYRFNKKDKARALALKLLHGSASENLRIAAITTLGYVKDAVGEKRVFNELLARLSDKSLHEKETAIFALGSYGSPAGAPYLHKLNNFSMYQIRVEAMTVEEQLKRAVGR